jgi:drug/metabolite transporter (DMT)-like permease
MSLVGSYVALSKPLVAVFPCFCWPGCALASAVWPCGVAAQARRRTPIIKPHPRLLFLESFLGNFLFSICMLFGVSMTTAVAAGVVMSSIPAVVAVLSWLFLRRAHRPAQHRRPLPARPWASGCFRCRKHPVNARAQTRVARMPLGQPAGVRCGGVRGGLRGHRQAPDRWAGPKRISAIINLWGFALVTPMGLCGRCASISRRARPAAGLLLFYGLAASVWTVWLWMTGLKRVPASQAGVFTVMLPISAALVGVLFMGERLTAMQLLAFGIALLGLVLATLPARLAQNRA